uniref:Uncharacterized protein n=1 Tax=Fundulus heteroclitus TaxID=8078 RepID=A0A146SX13_FUNHE
MAWQSSGIFIYKAVRIQHCVAKISCELGPYSKKLLGLNPCHPLFCVACMFFPMQMCLFSRYSSFLQLLGVRMSSCVAMRWTGYMSGMQLNQCGVFDKGEIAPHPGHHSPRGNILISWKQLWRESDS